MMPLGLALAGPFANVVGLRTWYVVGGAICLLIAVACLFFRPLMNIEQNGHAPAPRDSQRSILSGAE